MVGVTGIPTGVSLGELEALAVTAAVEAARHVTARRPPDLATAATKTSDTDVVTVMDTAAEQLLRTRLLEARPDDAILGEEGSRSPGSSGITWVVDPIDGTVNYLYGLPGYAVSVAAVVGDLQGAHWHPVAGAVCAPLLGRVWAAHRAGGAWTGDLDGATRTTLSVSRATLLGQALVGTGFSYRPEVRAQQARLLTRVLPAVRDIRRMGSAAVDLCLVAQGGLDAFYEQELNPWDLAAGWLVVTEAGGLVTGWAGGRPGPAGVLAGGPHLHPQLIRLLAAAPRAV